MWARLPGECRPTLHMGRAVWHCDSCEFTPTFKPHYHLLGQPLRYSSSKPQLLTVTDTRQCSIICRIKRNGGKRVKTGKGGKWAKRKSILGTWAVEVMSGSRNGGCMWGWALLMRASRRLSPHWFSWWLSFGHKISYLPPFYFWWLFKALHSGLAQ